MLQLLGHFHAVIVKHLVDAVLHVFLDDVLRDFETRGREFMQNHFFVHQVLANVVHQVDLECS